jgi:hypothetical protein
MHAMQPRVKARPISKLRAPLQHEHRDILRDVLSAIARPEHPRRRSLRKRQRSSRNPLGIVRWHTQRPH